MIVITGGFGFLGSNLVHALNARGYDRIIVADNLGEGDRWRTLARARFMDIVKPQDLMQFLSNFGQGVEAIVHFGGELGNKVTNIDGLLDDHYRNAIQLWDWCVLTQKRFFYASSASTFGLGEEGFEDTFNLDYLTRLRPVTPYGFAKQQFDKWVAMQVAAKQQRPQQVVGLKFFNIYGPHEYHEPGGGLIPQIFAKAQANEPCELYQSPDPAVPDGGQMRDFMHVDDAMDVVLWLLENPKISGLFNVGTGKGSSFFELASAVYAALYRAVLVSYKPLSKEHALRFAPRSVAKMDRLRAAGYSKPFTPLAVGVQKYVEEFLVTERRYK